MDLKRFELTMEKFFQKAGVSLLKKGSDYQAGDEAAPYILLDPKRKTYYLTETDVPDAAPGDMETEAAASWLAENENIPEPAARAVLSLGKAVNFFSMDLKLPGADIMELARKSALIISEDNAPGAKSYLDGKGITYQSVPFKGAFLVMFLDRGSSEQVADIYNSVSEEYMAGASGGAPGGEGVNALSFDDLLKDVPPLEEDGPLPEKAGELPPEAPEQAGEISFDDILKDVPPAGGETEPGKETGENAAEEPAGETPNEDRLLDSLDLSFMQKAPEPELSEKDGDLLYSKIINEQAETVKDAPSPKARSARDVPKDVIEGIGAEEEHAPVASHEAKTPAQAKAAPENPAKVKGIKTPSPFGGVRESAASKIASNLAGFIFFAPSYILGKLAGRVLPPFVIYWLGAIAVMFGVYQTALSFLSPLFYPEFLGLAGETASYLGTVLSSPAGQVPLENAANGILLSSAVFFSGQAAAVSAAENGWLLRYLMSFGAILMIFPLSRSFGARITVFSVLLFFAAPLILGAETYMLTALSDLAASAAGTVHAASVFASGAAFAVFAAPVILIVALFWVSGYFVPLKSKHKEVLP